MTIACWYCQTCRMHIYLWIAKRVAKHRAAGHTVKPMPKCKQHPAIVEVSA